MVGDFDKAREYPGVYEEGFPYLGPADWRLCSKQPKQYFSVSENP